MNAVCTESTLPATGRVVLRAALLCGSFCGLLGGCETTGNPREGGLFGWSREKAMARQAELADQAAAAVAARDVERSAVGKRQADKATAQQDVAVLELEVRLAEQHSSQLEAQLAALAAKHRDAAARERALLREIEARRAQRADAARQGAALPRPDIASHRRQLDSTEAYNARLNAGILRLLAD